MSKKVYPITSPARDVINHFLTEISKNFLCTNNATVIFSLYSLVINCNNICLNRHILFRGILNFVANITATLLTVTLSITIYFKYFTLLMAKSVKFYFYLRLLLKYLVIDIFSYVKRCIRDIV